VIVQIISFTLGPKPGSEATGGAPASRAIVDGKCGRGTVIDDATFPDDCGNPAIANTATSDGCDCRVRVAITSCVADESVLDGVTFMLLLSLILWRHRTWLTFSQAFLSSTSDGLGCASHGHRGCLLDF
jgi:hypothetical protein